MFKKIIVAALLFAATGNKSFAQNPSLNNDSTITIKVKGITCKNDLVTLSNNVKELKGVTICEPGKAGPVSTFKISFDPALVNRKDIYSAIENTGGCSDPKERPYKVKSN